MIQDFDRDGIQWNAYTSSNEIVFYMTGLDEKIDKHKNKYLDALQSFEITKEQFENERQIVLQEYEDTFNDQSQAHSLNLTRKLFNDYDPIGLKEDLEKLKFMDCLNFYELQYAKPTKIINVSKNKKIKNLDIEFCLSPFIEKDNAAVHFLNAMLSLGLKSPLYDEIREKRGLVYYIHCYQARYNKQGIISIDTQTSNRNFDGVIDGIQTVLKDTKRFLNKDRFDLVKDYYMVRREKDEILRYTNVNQWIQPEGWSVYDILDDIKLSDIKKVYEKYYDFDKFYISNDKKEFKK